ncbi:MAG: S26 family signal peptidase [Pseudomonadota bacterium]
MLIRWLAPAAVACLCGATLLQIVRPSVPRLLYNPSPSAPVGWYRLRAGDDIGRGDLVAARLSGEGARLAYERGYLPQNIPVIKTVWAADGARICHIESRVQVAGRHDLRVLSHDALDRPLPSRQGCYTLSDGQVFLVSTDVQTSFDSRYFGPVSVDDVLGPVDYLGQWRVSATRAWAGRGADE